MPRAPGMLKSGVRIDWLVPYPGNLLAHVRLKYIAMSNYTNVLSTQSTMHNATGSFQSTNILCEVLQEAALQCCSA